MDAELVALTSNAANTVVTLLATDVWQRAVTGVTELWRRVHPDRADPIEADLTVARTEVLAARAAGGGQAQQLEDALVNEWQGRLRRLLTTNPDLAAHLRILLDEELGPALGATAPSSTANIEIHAEASGHGRNYLVGQGEQYISEL